MYDVTIIGAGPAGISASLYTKRANLNVLVLYNGDSNVEEAHKIDNYYGFPNGISGKELYENGINQAQNLGVDVKKVEVLSIVPTEGKFVVKTIEESYKTKTVILAAGNKKVKPQIPGIRELEGRGVSYCAVCDAFFYRGKNVAVLGNGNFALKEAEELSHVANSVIILTDGLEKPNTSFNTETRKIKSINGENKIASISFEDGEDLVIDGLFVALGEAGAIDFANDLGILQEGDNLRVNEKMETNVEGVYACGNITGGLLQVCKAVHEGAVAGMSAIQYARNHS